MSGGFSDGGDSSSLRADYYVSRPLLPDRCWEVALRERAGEMIERTDHLAPIVQEVPTDPYFTVLALAHAVATEILVDSGAPVVTV